MDEKQTVDVDDGKSGVVRLRVGDALFTTTRTTLERIGYFARMFSGRFRPADEMDGAIFIDRDGATFGLLLAFYRNQLTDADIAALPASAQSALLRDADYFDASALRRVLERLATEANDARRRRLRWRRDGCYVGSLTLVGGTSRSEQQVHMAIAFHERHVESADDDQRVLVATGLSPNNAAANLRAFSEASSLPDIWAASPAVSHAFARFAINNVKRGRYALEDDAFLAISLQQARQSLIGIVDSHHSLLLSALPGFLAPEVPHPRDPDTSYVPSFYPFSFVSWAEEGEAAAAADKTTQSNVIAPATMPPINQGYCAQQ